jgi:uncharacterized protein (UPF0548 family)
VFFLRRSFDAGAVLDAARITDVTYSAVGATLSDAMPAGYHHDRGQIALPGGDRAFRRAAEGLRGWQAHRAVGATVTPAEPPRDGATVIVALAVGPIVVAAPCRVVSVIEEEDRHGFAYGTLPGHPEEGEEAFIVERRGRAVTFEVTTFSRPAELLPRLGGPVTRAVQRRTTIGYLNGLRRWVASEA